jgi:TPR repeat protein
LGWVFFNGVGGKQSQEQAIEWLLKAAQQKYSYAYHNLGRVYSGEDMSNPPKSFRPDFEKACEWFQKSADAGNGDSAFLHGKIICDGLIPWKSKADALPVLESAAKAGHYESKDLLDEIKMDLAANTKDETKVWENLALFRNARAMSRLARKYRSGYGTKSDPVRTFRYETALHLLGHSATDSILDQMHNFTGSYTKGADGKTTRIISVQEKRFTPIYQALEKALENEDTAYYKTQAKRYLKGGDMYEDIGEAAIWFHLAADAGDASAKEQAALLDAQMDELQRATALAWVGWLKLYQKRLH